MVINGLNLPSIGLIRVKQLDDGERHTLIVYPPGPGPLAGTGSATIVELEVNDAEVRRIEKVAPHLIAATCHNDKTGIRPITVLRARKDP